MTDDVVCLDLQITKVLSEDFPLQETALFQSCRRLLQIGSNRRDPTTGALMRKPLKGSGGIRKLMMSPLMVALRDRYPKGIGSKQRVMKKIDPIVWDRLELSIQAIGLTILASPMIEANWFSDPELLDTWDRFKVFWVNYSLLNCRFSKGEPTLPNLGRAISSLKTLSSWAGWYAMDYHDNVRPSKLPDFPGYDKEIDFQPLTWFGGAALRLSRPWEVRLSDLEVKALCGARTFGRALPPAWGPALLESGKKAIENLSTPHATDPRLLGLYHDVAMQLGKRYPPIPRNSHMSLSKTSCYETSGDDGGKAASLVPPLKGMIREAGRWIKERSFPNHTVYDCYRRPLVVVIDNEIFPSVSFGDCSMTPLEETELFVKDIFPDATDEEIGSLWFWPEERFSALDDICAAGRKEVWLNPKIGLFLEQVALSDLTAYQHTVISPQPDGYVGNPLNAGEAIPYWNNPTLVRYLPGPQNLLCRFKVLGEPGYKARALTVGLASANATMSAIRWMVEPLFHSDPRARIGFEETNVLWEYLKYLNKKPDSLTGKFSLFVNTDFEAATDFLPLDLLRSMWDGFLKGNNVPSDHPIWVTWSIVHEPRHIVVSWNERLSYSTWTEAPGSQLVVQKRGSFMGEPFSFLNLTLYNLCTVTSAWMASRLPFRRLLINDQQMSDVYQFMKPDIAHCPIPLVIVGDDVQMVTSPRMREYFNEMVSQTGMRLSKGKDLASNRVMILCEEHSIRIDNKIEFIDIIKLRLLTRMTRLHSDNRAAILGKAAMLGRQLSWNPFPATVRVAKATYLDVFRRVLLNKLFIPKELPLELPANLGGISLPGRSLPVLLEEIPFIVRFLYWVYRLPIGDFLYWSFQIGRLNTRVKRGVEFRVDPKDLAKLFDGYEWGKDEDPITAPKKFFGRGRVLKELSAAEIEIPLSPYSGEPINRLIVTAAQETLSLVPISRIIDYEERIQCFTELIKDPTESPRKLSFARYQRRFYQFWRKRVGPMGITNQVFKDSSVPFDVEVPWSNIDQISRAFAIRSFQYVRQDSQHLWEVLCGPTFRLGYPSRGAF